MKKVLWIFVFLLMFFAHGVSKIVELPEIQDPHLILADKDQLYIAESNAISIYSLKNLKLVKKFGRMGEGPGELKGMVTGMDARTRNILVNSVGRVSWFTKQGKFIRQITDTTLGLNYKAFGKGFAGMRMEREKDGIFFSVNIFNEQIKGAIEVYRYPHPFFFSRTQQINPVNLRVSSYCVYRGLLYVDTTEGIIRVFDAAGKEQAPIDPEIKPEKITPAMEKKTIEFWKSNMREEYKVFRNRLEFPDHYPRIRDFQVADNRIYIFTNQAAGDNIELMVLDLGGKRLGTKMVPLADVNMLLPHLFTFYSVQNNRIYKLSDNLDTETWELHIIGPIM